MYNGGLVGGTTQVSKIKRGVMCAKPHKFFFIKPIPNTDAKSLSERLLGIKAIEEVDITEGEYGYVVKAKYTGEDDSIGEYIAKNMKGKYGVALSYYNLRKARA